LVTKEQDKRDADLKVCLPARRTVMTFLSLQLAAAFSHWSSHEYDLVTITDSSPDSITEIPQALIGVVGLFGV
jgi:hypothetical protein